MRWIVLALLCGCGRLDFAAVGAPGSGDGPPDTAQACPSGFAPDGSGGCAWVGGLVADPGFVDPTAWTSVAGAVVDATVDESGMRDPGEALFPGSVVCNGGARLSQSVVMPRLADAGPLVVELSYRGVDGDSLSLPLAPAVGLGPVWDDDLPPSEASTWVTTRRCLGAGQYAPPSSTGPGAPVMLQLAPELGDLDCIGSNVELDLDHVDLVPAEPGECPAVGQAVNGDAEASGGWVLEATAPSVAAITPGVGANGSHGVRLFLAQRCDDPVASDVVSIPTADVMPSPAFELYDHTTAGVVPVIELGAQRLAIGSGTAAGRTTRACVPAALRGGIYPLTAYLDGGPGTCSDALAQEAIVDDVTLVNDPQCGTDLALTDPGFESQLPLLGASSEPGKGVAEIQSAVVHAGNGALRLDASVTCRGGAWSVEVVAPASQPGAGPALAFFYDADPANKTDFVVITRAGGFTPTADGAWHAGHVCLDPSLGGRPQLVSFGREFISGTCEQPMPTEAAFVDDLALTTDPACPP